MSNTSRLTLGLRCVEEAAAVREITLAGFAEYDSVLKVPSSAMWERVEDVAGNIAMGGAVLASIGSQTFVHTGTSCEKTTSTSDVFLCSSPFDAGKSRRR